MIRLRPCASSAAHKLLAIGRQRSRSIAPQGRKVRAEATRSKELPRSADGEVDWSRVDWHTYDWRQYTDDDVGPAYQATLSMLDWPTLCGHVAKFAATSVGKLRCCDLEIGSSAERAKVRCVAFCTLSLIAGTCNRLQQIAGTCRYLPHASLANAGRDCCKGAPSTGGIGSKLTCPLLLCSLHSQPSATNIVSLSHAAAPVLSTRTLCHSATAACRSCK